MLSRAAPTMVFCDAPEYLKVPELFQAPLSAQNGLSGGLDTTRWSDVRSSMLEAFFIIIALLLVIYFCLTYAGNALKSKP
jgi:hypothetical protein